MKSLTQLVQHILEDIEDGCCTSTTKDFQTILRRVETEGLSFLTITLPLFCQSFERALEAKEVRADMFAGFSKHGALPRFLGGLLALVFDRKTGLILQQPSITAIKDIRQICLMFKKVELPCVDRRTRAAFAKYVEVEQELTLAWGRLEGWRRTASMRPTMPHIGDTLLSDYQAMSRLIWSDPSFNRGKTLVCHSEWTDLEEKVATHGHIPRHGPGATADRISGNSKYDLRTWHTRLEQYFPFDLFGVSNPGLAEGTAVEFLDPDMEIPVAVISVPKTLKTPRIIAKEPVCMQYAQQSIARDLMSTIEHAPMSRNSVFFRNQSENRFAALRSSKDLKLATLDLSEASDRVHANLVWLMLDHMPNLRDAVAACRSTRADVPGYGIIPLVKFASMGSALCFPVEAMVFYTIVQLAVHKVTGIRPSYNSVVSHGLDVRVYGDDIIVPVSCVPTVKLYLELFGLKVNSNKSFTNGKFRESCGMDAYDGEEVTTSYVRRMPPTDSSMSNEIVSWTDLCNQLFRAGYWKASEYCKRVVEGVLKLRLKLVSSRSQGIGLHSPFRGWVQVDGWNRQLHCLTQAVPVLVSKPRKSKLDSWGALLKCFLKVGELPFQDKKHLERAGRPLHVNIKVRRLAVS